MYIYIYIIYDMKIAVCAMKRVSALESGTGPGRRYRRRGAPKLLFWEEEVRLGPKRHSWGFETSKSGVEWPSRTRPLLAAISSAGRYWPTIRLGGDDRCPKNGSIR